jgi:probable rRNA maturation factor
MYQIAVQRTVTEKSIPSPAKFKRWAKQALQKKMPSAELTIRIVGTEEMRQLNYEYRKKNKPTNVLSFPMDIPAEFNEEIPMLGDIVICADVIKKEAVAQKKSEESHWAHMVVHGTLHLLGYDHEKNDEAEVMEAEEILIMDSLGFANPYKI